MKSHNYISKHRESQTPQYKSKGREWRNILDSHKYSNNGNGKNNDTRVHNSITK